LDGLYQFNDADIMVLGSGADTNEAQSRLISGAVTGVFLDGDDLATATGQTVAHGFLTNAAIDALARVGRTFTPVEGNTGTSAENIFVRQDGNVWSLAVFNYTSQAVTQTVNLARAGLPQGSFTVTNLWDGSTAVVSNSWNVTLAAKQSKIFQLALITPPRPVISSLRISNGSSILNGSNGTAGAGYYLLNSTNLMKPLSNWNVISTNSFDGNGAFSVTNPVTPGMPRGFYLLRLR
jgi:hypothetical protein